MYTVIIANMHCKQKIKILLHKGMNKYLIYQML
mgnify:FL=1